MFYVDMSTETLSAVNCNYLKTNNQTYLYRNCGYKKHGGTSHICKRQFKCILTVLIPTGAFFLFLSLWIQGTLKEQNEINQAGTYVEKILAIGKFIVALNEERGTTITYSASRTFKSQNLFAYKLDSARQEVDRNLYAIQSEWPTDDFLTSYGQAFRSPRLFHAVLSNHRSNVVNEHSFWEELHFYTKAIEAMLDWLNWFSLKADNYFKSQDSFIYHNTLYEIIPKWSMTHGLLLSSYNHLGAEQALCNAFNSVVCFNRIESLSYMNFSFSGEAMFHTFRISYPFSKWHSLQNNAKTLSAWKKRPHSSFFPKLVECRQEILASVEYATAGMDPSLCEDGRRNETHLKEVDEVLLEELENLQRLSVEETQSVKTRVLNRVYLSLLIFSFWTFYFLVFIVLKLACVIRKKLCSKKELSKKGKKILASNIPPPVSSRQHSDCALNDKSRHYYSLRKQQSVKDQSNSSIYLKDSADVFQRDEKMISNRYSSNDNNFIGRHDKGTAVITKCKKMSIH